MEWMEKIILGVVGFASGTAVSGGVFTTLIAVGLIPRFAGKTHTANYIFLYEEMVVYGTILGGLVSIYYPFLDIAGFAGRFPVMESIYSYIGISVLILYGLFAGIFVGCLALAIAEMLDSIPIFTRRMRFRHGIGIVILCMAIGKTAGSLIYFWKGFFG